MLHYETIDTELLELLKKIQTIQDFSELRLVGGTSLALQYGHRKSVDIDLFGKLDLNAEEISEILSNCGSVTQIKRSANINIFEIAGIKVDIVNYHYPWLKPHIDIDGLRLAQAEDIAAMKISAITGRGTKKDFVDLFELLNHFSLEDILSFYKSKYADGSSYLALKCMSYFDDAENNPDPIMLTAFSWTQIKKKIESEVNTYLK
ncbi:MAG: nucleotidyl transferase AbiEii/AbiGii toxin family protein [bacterium]|nr:nucleotidyl transferase AbiEii/AbiGii toxin family protein [bacterium]